MQQLSLRDLERLDNVKPVLLAILIDGIATSPFAYGIPRDGGVRTAARQNQLYKKGASKRDGYKKLSKHQKREAFDLYGIVDGKPTWDIDVLTYIAWHLQDIAIMKYGVMLRWGGDWDDDGIRVDFDPNEGFLDGGHFELKK